MTFKSSLLATSFLLTLAGALFGQQPGTGVWTNGTGNQIRSSPAVGLDDTIYVGSTDGKLYAFRPDGANQWVFATGVGIYSSPAIDADGTVYIGSLDRRIYAISHNGIQKWAFTTGGYVYSSPAIGPDGTVYCGSHDTRLYALNPDGTKRWEFATGGYVFSSPAVGADGTIYFGSGDAKVYALRPDGTKKWDYATGGEISSSPAIGPDGVIYVGAGDGKLYAVKNGLKQWEFSTGNALVSSPVLAADGTIYFGSGDGRLYALNPVSGAIRWSLATGAPIDHASPAVGADGLIYIGSTDGKLYAINSSGATNWTLATGAAISYSSPAIGRDGTVYIGSDDSGLYAIKGSAPLANTPWPMFGRDLRHSASGFVERRFPSAFYSPGLKLSVTLIAFPPPNISVYVVEDQPPPGWTVDPDSLSENGWYDAVNRKVKFEVFFDPTPQTNTYEVIPPLTDVGSKAFTGLVSADGLDSFVQSFIQGASGLQFQPLHPADNNVIDGRLTIAEITAYDAAWKQGRTWQNDPGNAPPTLIPANYLTRAVALWRGGESYSFTTNFSVPYCWTNTLTNGPLTLSQAAIPLASNSIAVADLSEGYQIGTPIAVRITVLPATNTSVYAVQDQPPAGWSVASVSDNGQYDAVNGTVKWGPFRDRNPRALTYQAIPSPNASGAVEFAGLASFDGSNLGISGQRQTTLNRPAASLGWRQLPPAYSPGLKFSVNLAVTPPTQAGVYLVEEVPPAGWTVGELSQGGLYIAATGKIVFGPFFDGAATNLTYELIPPLGETNVHFFSGYVSTEDQESFIGGDRFLTFAPLHPADAKPGDDLIAIGEVTAYAAAWKPGISWPSGPSPIPYTYMTNAIALWLGGELYRYDTNLTNAPSYWVNTQSAVTNRIVLPAPAVTNSGTAVAAQPERYQFGQALIVTIQVAPLTNTAVYAVEEQPPIGWTVAANSLSDDGRWDGLSQKIKWGPFFDNTPRILSYQAIPPTNVTGTVTFAGVASFDGADVAVSGQRQTMGEGAPGTLLFAERQLPPGYSPGLKLSVTLKVTPPLSVAAYIVIDQLPFGWTATTNLSPSGLFNATNGTVVFGPFFDSTPRTLTYEVIPPAGESGPQYFAGLVSSDVLESVISGDQQLQLLPFQPADNQFSDNFLTIDEMTRYSTAWKRGAPWPVPPSPVPFNYLTNAIALWLGGEYYRYDTNITNAPSYWVNAPSPITNGIVLPAIAVTNSGTAVADQPAGYEPGRAITNTITVTPLTTTAVYAVEEQLPAGWTVDTNSMSDGGQWDGLIQKIKWGPFFDNAPRILSYQARPASHTASSVTFAGVASFDGVNVAVTGQRQTTLGGALAQAGVVLRQLPAGYARGQALVVQLRVTPPVSGDYYLVEDQPPSGWVVSPASISNGGVWDEFHQAVQWGPFFDNVSNTLSYWVTPALNATGTVAFAGTAFFDGNRLAVGGQDNMTLSGVLTPAAARQLPPSYSPGRPLQVSLLITPPVPVAFFVVEDQPPSDWTVTALDEGGVYDSVNHKVKFENLFGSSPRILRYEVTPPLAPAGNPSFTGSVSADVWQSVITGDTQVELMPLHPADSGPADGRMSLAEVTAYDAAWMRGSDWPSGPSPIPVAYLARAIALWRGGEFYYFNANSTNQPDCWLNPLPAQSRPAWGASPPAIVATNSGAAVAILPPGYQVGTRLTVAITVSPATNILVYALEDQPPPGWLIPTQAISPDGQMDVANQKIKWGPFFDNAPRTFTYQVIPPPDATGTVLFIGAASFDGTHVAIIGQRRTTLGGAAELLRLSAPQFSPATGLQFNLSGRTNQVCEIQFSTNLVNWAPLFILTNRTGMLQVTDPAALQLPYRFYRARILNGP